MVEQRYDKASLNEDRIEMSAEVKNVVGGHENERLEKEGQGTMEARQKAVQRVDEGILACFYICSRLRQRELQQITVIETQVLS